ncbi:hypothetical protein CDFC105_43942 [Clostridioides difficile]|nr:hypothetical protein CDFC105_43942 [Clostridioides difficile]
MLGDSARVSVVRGIVNMMDGDRTGRGYCCFFFLMIRRPPRSTRKESSAASDVYKRQGKYYATMGLSKAIDDIENICEIYLSLIHISEPTRLGMISYAVFCLKKKKKKSTPCALTLNSDIIHNLLDPHSPLIANL